MKVSIYIEKLDEPLGERAGILTTSAAIRSGIPKDAFCRYVRNRNLEKDSQGVYVAETPSQMSLRCCRRAFRRRSSRTTPRCFCTE